MPTADDESLARLALDRGLLTPAQAKAALDRQAREPGQSLATVLRALGLLSEGQLGELRDEVETSLQETLVDAKKASYACPSCRSKFTVTRPKPGHAYRCPKCSAALEKLAPPAAGAAEPGARFGRYVLQGELGKGGMGIVYKAWDPEGGRPVAIKCMLRTDDPTEVERFHREARTATGLSHPNIVKVYDAGVHEERPYLVMEYVSGDSLSQLLSPHRAKDRRPSMEQSLSYVRDAALALGHAHERNIVHRDVKPQNIMVTDAGEVKVMDFGLAREMARGLTVTTTGSVIGTPQYMSPEQARGDREALGPRTDVWALGVMLYEVAARASPFDGETAAEVLHKVTHEDAVPVRKRNPRVPRDLETVIMKCLESDPAGRYATGTRLAEDLGRHLEGVPVTARPPGLLKRIQKKVARRKGMALASAAGVLAVALVSAVLLPKLGTAKKEAEEASAGRTQAELSMKLWAGISNSITEAEINARAGEVARAREKLDQGIAACRDFLKAQELPHAHYFLGRLLRSRGKAAEALAELDAAVRADARLGEARHERGLIKVERYQAQMNIARLSAISLRGGGRPPTREELVKENPDLGRLREEARADLSVGVGQSSYFRPVDGLFGRARLAELQGDLEAAAALFKKVLEQDPSYALALASLARIANEVGLYDEAIARASEALRKHQGLGAAYLERCEALLYKVREGPVSPELARWNASALEDADRAIAMGEETELAYYTRGNAKWLAGDIAAAIRDYGEAVRINPRAAGAFSNRGSLRAQSGDHDGALEDFAAAIRVNPGSAEAHTNRALSLEAKGDAKGAMAEHDEAIRVNPGITLPYTNRAAFRSRTGDREGAQADCDEALKLDPDNAVALYNRGVNFLRKGQRDQALRDFDRAIESNPLYAEAFGNRGFIRSERKEYEAAIADLDRAIGLAPSSKLHRLNRGNARRGKGDLAGALEDYDGALKIGPDLLTYYNRGALRDSKGDFDGAIADQTEAIKLDPSFAASWRNRGSARSAKGDAKGALADYDEALRIEPRHSGTLTNRALVREGLGDIPGAIRDLDEAIAIDPRNSIAWNNRGNARHRRDEYAKAIADYSEAIRINPRYVTAFFMRGVACGKKGDLKEAVADLRKALEFAPPTWPYRGQAEALIRGAGEKP